MQLKNFFVLGNTYKKNLYEKQLMVHYIESEVRNRLRLLGKTTLESKHYIVGERKLVKSLLLHSFGKVTANLKLKSKLLSKSKAAWV